MGTKINISWNLILLMDSKGDFQNEERLKELGNFHFHFQKKKYRFHIYKDGGKKEYIGGDFCYKCYRKKPINNKSLPKQGTAS